VITIPLAAVLPEHSNDGYVAAAYIVFVAIVLIYVAIMALRLSHVERDLRDLQARTERPGSDGAQSGGVRQDETRRDGGQPDGPRPDGPRPEETHDQTRERETV
jgi:hypothetical protein